MTESRHEIDISSLSHHPLGRILHYYDTTPKETLEGRRFNMYAGYYYYLITRGDNPRFLRAQTWKDLEVKRFFEWENVPALPVWLMRVLRHNLELQPLALGYLRQTPPPIAIWEEPDRALRNNERRWLRVVNTTLRYLYHQSD